MTIRHKTRFGPEKLLTAPRRGPAYPSPDGKLAVYTKSIYSFDSHSKSTEISVLDIASGQADLLTTDVNASEPKWLGEGHELVWLKQGENGNTSFVVSDASAPGKCYTAGTVPGPLSNLKVVVIEPGTVAVAITGQANPDGSLHNPKDKPKTYSTARIYDALFVRHWDSYVTSQTNTVFTALLRKTPARVHGREGRYNLVGFTNVLKGTGLECPIPPFGGTDHFDISRGGLLIVSKDPDLNPATHTKSNAYFISKEDLMDMTPSEPQKLDVPGFEGAASSPVFSPDGTKMAFLQMREDGYESDRNEIIVFLDIDMKRSSAGVASKRRPTICNDGKWDRSPSSITWSNDSNVLYVQAEDHGVGCLYMMTVPPEAPIGMVKLTDSGAVLAVAPASATSHKLFVSFSSLVDNSYYGVVDPFSKNGTSDAHGGTAGSVTFLSSVSNSGADYGLSKDQCRNLWWQGDGGHLVHAWMVVPSFFRSDQKYPLAYLIHGGPQGAWNDQWSTRWNPALFAEQGYVVICPNPTGSTGYGQEFTDRIKNNWGGSPYVDLEEGFKFIEKALPFVDTERAVALGASYGGYMMNWIQGHPLGKKFKTLVCHDGVFSMTGQLASEEQYFPMHDLGGPLWTRQEVYDRWDPSRFTANWATPMLVIHNELDYRLTMAEGLSAFNVLQIKGIDSRFLSFPDENHWVLKQENSLIWHLVVLNWINKYVGLPKITDRSGRDGSEYLRQSKRKVPSDK